MAKKKNGLTKLDMVRQALGTLGRDAKPLQIQAWVKEQFQAELSTDLISTYKKDVAGKRKKRGRPAGPRPKQSPAPAQGRNGISLGDIEAVKGLIGRVGAGQLRGLIDLLSR